MDSQHWLQVWESAGQTQSDKAVREAGTGQLPKGRREAGVHAPEGVTPRTLPVSLQLRVPRKQQAALCAAPSTAGASSF